MVLHRTLIAAAVLAATAPAWASTEEAARAVEEPAQADAAEPASDEGESVVVRDRAGESLTSFTHLTREDIARRPTEDGNITDLLKSNPAVQFSNHGDGSLQMGEIKPSNISIHGSVAYQNNYTLDGISTNSDLDPAEQTSVTTTRLGGSDEQGFYVDSRLIDSVTVYDHNIPASFGGFTGGVIDAQTCSWSGENHISVFGRMTKSGWSRIHTDSALDVGSGDADVSKPAQFQTDFEKKTYGFTGEWGITDNLGVVVGYTRRESKIPTVQVPGTRVSIVPDDQNWTGWGVLETPVAGGTQTQRRTADNFFAKATLYATPWTEASLALTYSGYESKGFLTTVADSGYEDHHDGLNLTASVKHRMKAGVLDSSLAYTRMTDKRTSDVKNWTQLDRYTIGMDDTGSTSTTSMTSAASGGLGDLESTQSVINAKTRMDCEPVMVGSVSHQFSAGADLSSTHAEYRRGSNYYRWGVTQSVMQSDYGEFSQTDFYTTRWKAGTYEADYNQAALFGEHRMGVGDFMIRTGLRAEYDDFTKDVNIAPRFTTSWDLFGNGGSVITVGANRYYGRNILTYALYKAQNGGMENIYDYVSDDSPAADGWFAANDFDGLERLKTPFSDEFSIGLTQRLGDWSASAAYVHRNGHDEVRSRSRTEGSGYDTRFVREFYNGGESEHDSVIFSINNTAPLKFAKANHWVRFSAAWQETKSNAAIDQGYSELESGKTVNMDKVWYDGSVIDAEDLDSTDFNIPVKFDLEATSEWAQWGLTWYNFLHLSLDRSQAVRDDGEYYAWTHEGEYGPMTEQIRKYSRVDFASAWSWDTKVLYRPDWARGVGVSLEVYNVTNNRNASDVFVYKGTQYKSYDPGRQFWVQLSYDY